MKNLLDLIANVSTYNFLHAIHWFSSCAFFEDIFKETTIFVQLDFSSTAVVTDKKSSWILIYLNSDTDIYTENDGRD